MFIPPETPCIVADAAVMRANIQRMQALCDRHGCALRPHIKTHKSAEIARAQVAAGAVGITCAKVSEAEVMADGGVDDIFIAYPLIGESKTERAMRLAKRCRRLILAADSLYGAEQLSRAAARHGVTVEVRLEIDTGAQRTGVVMENAAALAQAVAALPGLRLTGIFTFKGMVHDRAPTLDYTAAAREECTLLRALYEKLRDRGVAIQDISAGSTPTGPACAETGLVNEIRPGTYVFYDQMNYLQGVCEAGDIAARLYATVVSVQDGYAVVDGGSKTFPTDVALDKPPLYFHSYAYVPGRDDLRLARLSEEHGMLTGGGDMRLAVGDVLPFIPAHICPAVNLRDYIYLLEDGRLRKLRVDARGMSV